MAIDPTTVNILNIIELQTATSVQDNDLLVIGQGIYARKSTVLALYNKFGIQSLVENVNTLQGDVADLGLINAVQFSPQILTVPEQEQARDNILALGIADLDGFVYDVTYNSANHQITFYSQNEPNIVIDLPIEQLIKGVQLVGDDLVFTFEDGSTVTVPLNTLLVGVVKSVNGLTPNSQGEVVISWTDIPGKPTLFPPSAHTHPISDVINLQTELNTKANVDGGNIVNSVQWRTNLGVYSTTQVDGLLSDFVKKDGSVAMTGNLSAQSISAQTGFDKLTFDTLENFGSPLKINSNASLGINLQANGVTVLGVYPGSIEAFKNVIVPNAQDPTHAVNLGQVNGVLGGYLPLTGGVLSGNVNFAGNTIGLKINNTERFVGYNNETIMAANNDVLFFRPNTITSATGSVYIDTSGVIYTTNGNGTSADWNAKVSQSQLGNYAQLSQVYTQSQALALFVGLNGVQTIADTKTFTSSPIVPNGTLNGHTVNLGQMQTYVTGLGYVTQTSLTTQLNDKVDKVAGKQLSTEDYTSAEKTKLNNIAAGAEVNVNADWNATSGDAQILNKPTIPTNNNQLTNGAGYQNASQVQNEVSNQISNLNLPPNPHSYQNITTNGSTIDASQYRRVVAVFSDPAVGTASLPNSAFPGTVVTLQTTSVQVDVTMDYRRPNSSGGMLPIEAHMSVQVSFSEDQSAWIVEQINSLS